METIGTQDNTTYHEMAARCKVRFDGLQRTVHYDCMPLFTHKEYGTFVMTADETLEEAIERKRVQFEGE